VDLHRLLNPRSVAVVGATPREDTYAHETLRNLALLGFEGSVWGVNPRHREVRGRPVVPSLSALPEPVDAVVVAVPAAATPAVVEEAGRLGCGGAVVLAAGFAEAGEHELQDRLAAAAARHDLPLVGPNCNGIVRLHRRAALWGDALAPQEPGPVAVVTQSGNFAVNALATRRGLRLHTVASCGNQAVLDATDMLAFLAGEDGVRAVALHLEDEGDGPRLCEALARCAERGVGVAVLKGGTSAAGASAAAAHTGSVAGDHRVFRALAEEAGAAWARDWHELLELAKALAAGARARGRGVALVTCSGGDCVIAADEAKRVGLELPPLAPATAARLRELLPPAASVANPLDYTAQVWGDAELLRDLIATVGADAAIDQVLVLYDQPPGIGGWSAQTWDAVREGILLGARGSDVPVLVASTLPELLDDDGAATFGAAGVPALCGLPAGLLAARALLPAPTGIASRLRSIAEAATSAPGTAADGRRAITGGASVARFGGGRWLAEHEAKALLARAGVAVVPGRTARDEEDALAAAAELGWPVAVKASSAALRHKTEAGALALGVGDEPTLRGEYRRLAALGRPGAVLVERMAAGAVELLVAARRDAVVPCLVVALGGTWTELLGDAAVLPLPAEEARIAEALRSLRGAPLLTGGRGRPPLDVEAAAALAAAAGRALLDQGLELLELNPVMVGEQGAVAVDAVARELAREREAA
jgi:acyl-CoA synthetase (NDP forming)